MAIDAPIFKLLARDIHGQMLTLGRQHWCVEPDLKDPMELRPFCEAPLLTTGLVSDVKSMDVDPSEGCTFVRDLNKPIPPHFESMSDTIFDGGTLEHVFNVPVALESVRRMLRIGGTFCSHQLQNLSGHGFYTLSPELLWSWSVANGFAFQECLIARLGPWATWRRLTYKRARMEFTSVIPLQFYFRAIKTRDVQGVPQQAGPTSGIPFWRFLLWRARIFQWPKI